MPDLSDAEIEARIKAMLEERWSKLEDRTTIRSSEKHLVSRADFVLNIIEEFKLHPKDFDKIEQVTEVWSKIQADSSYIRLSPGGFLLPCS